MHRTHVDRDFYSCSELCKFSSRIAGNSSPRTRPLLRQHLQNRGENNMTAELYLFLDKLEKCEMSEEVSRQRQTSNISWILDISSRMSAKVPRLSVSLGKHLAFTSRILKLRCSIEMSLKLTLVRARLQGARVCPRLRGVLSVLRSRCPRTVCPRR